MRLLNEYEHVNKVSFAGDLWDANSENYLGSTFSHITLSWLLQTRTLSMRLIIDKKNALNLKANIDAILNEWQLSRKVISRFLLL